MDGSGSHKERNTVERAGLEELVFESPRGNAGRDCLDFMQGS